MNAHEVEPETVKFVFVLPVAYRINNILTDHRALGSGFVAATGAVRRVAVRAVTVIVVRNYFVKVRVY